MSELVFLEGNGVRIPEATDELYTAMIALAQGHMDKLGVAALLRRICRAA